MNSIKKPATFNPFFLLSRSDYTFIVTLIVGLVIVSRSNYLLFHSLVEVAIITTGFLSFAFTWHLRRFEFGPLLVIGILLGCTSIINIFHMLSFKGMGVLGNDANLPTQLWIASRYLFSIVVLITLTIPKITFNPTALLGSLLLTTAILLGAVFKGYFPVCFIQDVGQTPFKIYSEYIISFFLIISMAIFWMKGRVFSERVNWLILLFFGFSILTELVFTSYLGVYDLSNMMGHIFQLTATYFLYKAVVETGLVNPFELMFKNLNDAVNTRDEFISIASHELKTPLTPLKLHLQMLQRELLKENEDERNNTKILKAARTANELVIRLNQLIDGMLDVSRLSTGKFEIFREKTNLSELLSHLVQRYESQILAANSKLVLKLEQVESEVDALRIEQVLINLILNAIKYAPSSTIEIGLTKTDSGKVQIWVSDTGPGIPKEFKERIFNRYERGSSETAVGGLGLGLYISRQIVEAHGGTLVLESGVGLGAKFLITL